ncbi:MAG: DUF1826 domain-containing protein [Acidithiobacillus sp.]
MTHVAEALPSCEVALCPNTLIGLLEIFEPDCQIAVAERALIPAIDAYLANAAQEMGEGYRISLNLEENWSLPSLPPYPGREAFAADLKYLVEVYGDLMGCPAVGLRLGVLCRAMCPRFHVDHTSIRLLCTYRGSGTEWLPDACADRGKLGPRPNHIGDENSGVIINPDGIQHVPPLAIALLKGSMWEGNAERGVIHRSPAVTPDVMPRVFLALDALW